ncbi:MAG TPA: DUF2142 domain-containing protein [Acidimicrobiales bacterium]|nr:DUF2142 domain-containing protein [Acidimicrobiales bacterium]
MRSEGEPVTTRVRWGLAAFAVPFALSACWALTSPIYAGPDEPVHVTKAAAVVRGQLVGKPLSATTTLVRVPLTFAQPGYSLLGATCFGSHPERPASCQRLPQGSTVVSATPYVGRYSPLYYLLVGWPSLTSSSTWTLYAMRLASAAVCAGLLAAGLWLLLATRRRWLVLGFLVGMTPAVAFFGGTVNPSSLEIAAGLCLWAAAIAWLADRRLGRSCAWTAAIAGSVLVQLRWGSILLVALIAMTVIVLGARVQLRRWMVPVAISAVFGATWQLAEHGWVPLGPPAPPSYSVAHLIRLSIGRLDGYFHDLVGVFGSPTPSLAFAIWLFTTGFLLFAAWSTGEAHLRSALAIVVLALLIVPVAMNVIEAPTSGYAAGRFGFYQSRYLMPYSLGLPLVAAYGLVRAGRQVPPAILLALVGVGQLATFVQALRRYTVGVHGPVLWFGGSWSPPYLGAIAPVLIFAVALAALLAGTWWIAGGEATGISLAQRPRRLLSRG